MVIINGIEGFFNPESIAVIGATSDPKKFGNAITSNILNNNDLKSEIFLISNRSQIIRGLRTYNSILEVTRDIDLAVILVPANFVSNVIDQCIEKKVKKIIIISAGFGEINEDGKKLEKEIANKCKKSGIRVIGPNCVGIQNVNTGLNASFIQTPPKGSISMITQSGSFGVACLYEMNLNFLGCAKFANLGNLIDVSFDEILYYFKNDPETKVICIYVESISEGKTFFDTIKEIVPFKPIIAIKGGRTKIGMSAATSHTGSIASNYKILKAAVNQAGAIMCEDIYDYITALKTFSYLPMPKGDRIGVLTNSGGTAVLFSDYIEKFRFKLAEFSDDLKKKITPFLISLVKVINPLDMIAGAEEEQYYQVTKAMLEDPNIDIVVPCTVIPPFLGIKVDEHFSGMIRAWNETKREKPLIPLILFGNAFRELKLLAEKEKIPFFVTPREAGWCCKFLIDRMNFLKNVKIPNL